jgi:hypothetical protein
MSMLTQNPFEQSIDNNQIGHDSDMNALMGEVE